MPGGARAPARGGAAAVAACRTARARPPALGLEVHAGHGIDYETVGAIAAIPELAELNIGHFLIGEAIFTGLDPAIRRMRAADGCGRARDADRGGGGLIIGIGSDLADIRRIEQTLERFGERFVAAHLHRLERARSERKADRAASYAKRFAAKEACAKALGTGMRRGVFWRDMGVVNPRSGQPTMALTGGAAKRLAAMTPAGLHSPSSTSPSPTTTPTPRRSWSSKRCRRRTSTINRRALAGAVSSV